MVARSSHAFYSTGAQFSIAGSKQLYASVMSKASRLSYNLVFEPINLSIVIVVCRISVIDSPSVKALTR
jgi:hypothetical protein